MIIIHFCHLSFGFFATGRTHHATCHLHAPESPGTVVLVFITSPLEVISATSAAMCFGKCCGIIDHSKKQHCRTAHDFRPPFRHGNRSVSSNCCRSEGFICADISRHSLTIFSNMASLSRLSTLECTSREYLYASSFSSLSAPEWHPYFP